MIRFILSCLVALSMIGSAPAVAAMAAPLVPQAGECTMNGGDMPAQPTDHGKTPCCATDCTMAGAAAVAQPATGNLSERWPAKALLANAPTKQLDSLDWATVDPPPRT